METNTKSYQTQLEELLEFAIKEQASDLHLSSGNPPTLRIAGRLIPLLKKNKLTSKGLLMFVTGI